MSTNDTSLTAAFLAAQKRERERERILTRGEFFETTFEYAAGMQFLAKAGDGSRWCANLCLHYTDTFNGGDAPGYIGDIELPDRINVEDLEAYAAVFYDAAKWYREYKKTRIYEPGEWPQ